MMSMCTVTNRQHSLWERAGVVQASLTLCGAALILVLGIQVLRYHVALGQALQQAQLTKDMVVMTALPNKTLKVNLHLLRGDSCMHVSLPVCLSSFGW